jgi:plastocyanin
MNQFKALMFCLTLITSLAYADEPVQEIAAHDKQFFPAEITLPAGTKIRLVVKNQESIPIEFESTDLSREVLIMSKAEKSFFIGPLEPGRYVFFNDYNRKARGLIIVK